MKTAITLANTIFAGNKSEQYLVFSIIFVTIGKSLEAKIPVEVNSLIVIFLAISLIGMKLQFVNNQLKKKILFNTFQNRY
jgi:hypothetical protein|nr:hypothetical protein [uncultured Flavobacterium sp.]